jgi:hypothetical protein
VSIPGERLRELKEALLLGDPLDPQQRFELVGLLEYLSQQHQPRPGRPVDQALRRRAGVVGVLHDKHGVPLKAAIFAAAPTATPRERSSVERVYRALRASADRVEVPERAIRAALQALGRK